jgi:hypothetical protein
MSASVSGSPKRTLYSRSLGPSVVSMKPVKRRPTNGKPEKGQQETGGKKRRGIPSLRMPSMVGRKVSVMIRCMISGVATGAGA